MYAASIRAELERAAVFNEKARRCRQRAGALLREAGTRRDIGAIAHEVGLDQRMIELLMGMAAPRRNSSEQARTPLMPATDRRDGEVGLG